MGVSKSTLSEQDRARLDEIVSQMQANNEPEDNIRFVVEDFKAKYSKKKDGTELSGSVSEVGTQSTSPSTSQSKSTSGGNKKFSLDPTNFLNKEEEEPLLPQPRKKEITPENLKAQKSFEQNLFGVSKYGNKTLRIDRGEIDNNGVAAVQEIEIDPRTIPVSPYKNVTDDVFLGTVRKKIMDKQPLNAQEEAFLKKNQRPISSFTIDDDRELENLTNANGLSIEQVRDAKIPDLIGNLFPQVKGKTFGEVSNTSEGKYAQIQTLKAKIKRDIEQAENVTTGATGQMKDTQKIAALNEQLAELDLLETKAARQLVKIADAGAEGVVRTDNTGSNWERFKKSAADLLFMGSAFIPEETNEDIELRVSQLPSQFITGLDYTKYKEPVEFERVSRALAQGKPISETQIANLTNIGIDIEKEKLKDEYTAQTIDKPTFDAKNLELSVKAYDNLVGNKEVLRGFLSSNIAEVLDGMEKGKAENNVSGLREFGEVFGMRWNYTDEEIDYAAQVVAKTNGLNVDDPRVKEAVQYLKDNEGAMIMQNSISKSGFTRDFAKGLAQPIRGIVSTIEGLGKTSEEIYAEGQSQGNVNVSEQPVKRIANSWEGTVGKVFEGAGQLVSQAGLAYLTGGAVGGAGRAILGRGGVAALEGDIALADMAASDLAGAGLYKGKDFVSTFVTTFASTYDGNLKSAQTYTADDGKAMAVAGGLSGVEALAENILSPLDIARGVGKTLFGKTPTQKIINILDDDKILNKSSAVKDFLTGTLKAGLASGRMVVTEIGEEQIVGLADYGANMITNPNSQSFKNRVLKEELFEIGIETGLSMAIPALLTGVGAFNTNSFAKGSLIIAAQNRQMMVDALDKNLADGAITQDKYNQKLQIVNSAATANEELPLKADGSKLNSEQKADYIYSRVSEGALKRKIELSNDEAEKSILQNKIAEQQKFREEILKTPTNVQSETTENVSTETQNNEGTQGQVNEAENAPNAQDAEIVIDEPTLQTVRDNAEGVTMGVYKNIFQTGDATTVSQALKEVSDQWHDTRSQESAERTFGKGIVDLAKSIYPQELNNGVTINTQTNEQEKETNPNEVLGGVRQEGNQDEGGQEGQQLRQERTVKTIIEPTKPISEMNSEELYQYAKDTRSALNKQDKYFEGKSEKEKEDAGYYDVVDNVEDLRDAAQRVNFVENSENLQELANSVKSILVSFDKDNPSETTLAVLNAAKNKAVELGIETNDLIKGVIASVGNDYQDKEDAEFMMRNALEKIAGVNNQNTIANEPTPTVATNPVLKDVESTAKALDDKYFEDKRIGNQKQLEILDLIPKEQIDNPNENGFYRVSKMDEDWVSKQPKEVQENVKKLNDIFKERNREEVISEAYHKAKADGNNPELIAAVESLLSEQQTIANETTTTVSEPVQPNATATEEQRSEETVSEGTTNVGQGTTTATPPVQPTPTITKEKRIEEFNKKADATANALIDFLTPKTTKGVKKSGLGVEEIVRGATAAIKAAYAASQNIKEAIDAGVKYFTDNWDENELGELPIDAVRAKLQLDFLGGMTQPENPAEGVSMTHAATAETINEFMLPEYQKEAQTLTQWDAEAVRRIENGEMPALLDKLRNFGDASPVEVRMLGMYIANLKTIASQTKNDEDIARMYEAVKLSDMLGSKEGKALRARRGLFLNGNTLADYFQEEMDAIGTDTLTEDQKTEIEKEYNAIKQAKEEWEKERERLNVRVLELEAQAAIKKEVAMAAKKQSKKKTPEDFSKEREKIFTDIKQKLKDARKGTNATIVPYANELFAIAPDVAKLVKNLVEEGVVTLTEIVASIKENLIDEIPQITDSDVRDLVAGAYNQKVKTKKQLSTEIFELKEEARLINKLAALEAGELPKTEKAKVERNKNITDLRKQIEKFRKDNPTDKERLDAVKKSYETRIKQIEEDLRTGNFNDNPTVRPPVKLDAEAIAAKDKLVKLQSERKLRILRAEYANKSKIEKGRDVASNILNIPRALMTTLDFSAVLRQGIIPTISGLLSTNPKRIFNALGQMFKSGFSKKEYDRWFFDVEQSPDYEVMKDSGLALTDNTSPDLTVREEVFMSNFVSKIPLVGYVTKVSERSYAAYINKIRVDLFRSFANAMEERGMTYDNSTEAYEQLAKYVNNATGRGGLPKVAGADLNTISPLLNGIFFSPRLISSRLNMLTYFAQSRFYTKVPKEVRNAYFADMAKFIGLGVSVLALASMAGGDGDDEDKVKVEQDPRSSDFGKIRSGNSRWDIWGGFQPFIRVAAQVISGERKSTKTGQIMEINGEGPFGTSRFDVLAAFARGKLSPVPAMAVDILSRRTAGGDRIIWELNPSERSKQITITNYLGQHLLPLTVTGLYDAMKEDGSKALLTTGLPSIFGVGVQSYGNEGIEIIDDLPKVGPKQLERLEAKGIKTLDDLKKYKGRLKTLKYEDDEGDMKRIFTAPQVKSIDSIFSLPPKPKK